MILGPPREILAWLPPDLGGGLRHLLEQTQRTPGTGTLPWQGLSCSVEEHDLLVREAAGPRWEGHQRMVDLHCVLAGRERCGWAPRNGLSPLEAHEERDLFFYAPPQAPLWLDLTPGVWALFTPSDLHLPALPGSGGSTWVRRAVLKFPCTLLQTSV